jgi:hypothetical protein
MVSGAYTPALIWQAQAAASQAAARVHQLLAGNTVPEHSPRLMVG